VVWARSAWAGNQRYPLHWGGDNSPNFHNMVPQLEGGLSFGMSGFQFWSHDIGGFCGDTQGRLLIRWMQVGMFLSHCRIHGFARRELYKFDAETLRICRDFIRLRYRLLPYIHGQAQRCIETSLPMLRALVVEYQDDPNVWNLGNEYLFGDDLLVAPICDESDRRRVYLPKGIWTDWWTRKRLRGGRWIEAKAGIETLPLYLREGAIVPLGPWMNYVDEKPTEEIELLVSRLERDGTRRFDIPINGTTIPVKYTCADGAHSITIGKTGVRITVVGLGGEIAVQPG
jgi:alpha-D-xyloside xylohydrolase